MLKLSIHYSIFITLRIRTTRPWLESKVCSFARYQCVLNWFHIFKSPRLPERDSKFSRFNYLKRNMCQCFIFIITQYPWPWKKFLKTVLIKVMISLKIIFYNCFSRYMKHDFKMLVNGWWYRNIIWYCQNTYDFMCQMKNSLLFPIQWGLSNNYNATSFQNSPQVPTDNNVFLDNFCTLLSFVSFLRF